MLLKQYFTGKILTALLFSLAVSLVAAVGVLAVNDSTDTANTLKISPVRTDIEVARGQSKTIKIIVTNPSDNDVMVRPIQNDFVAGDENGTPALILDEDEYADSHSLKRFLKPLKNVSIAAGDSKTIEVTIAVPANAEAGGYFGAIRFAPVSPDDGGQVNLSPSVASLILLTVPGSVSEKLNLTEFVVSQNGNKGTFFTGSDKISIDFRFANTSNIQLAPFGKISVTKGDEVVHQVDFNNKTQRDMVLPDSARRWSVPLVNIDGFGKYTVRSTFTYGSDNQTIETSKTFWVVPLVYLVGGLIALLLLIVVVAWLIYSRQRNRLTFGNRKRR